MKTENGYEVVRIDPNGRVHFANGESARKDRNNLWLYEQDDSPWESRRTAIVDGKLMLEFTPSNLTSED